MARDRLSVFSREPSTNGTPVPADATPPFSMLPKELILGFPCLTCIPIYAYLDLRQGTSGRPAQGLQYVADQLGMQPRTLGVHLGHLADAGWVRLTPDHDHSQTSKAKSQVRMEVIHNPSRGRRNPDADHLDPRSPRAHKKSKYTESLTPTTSYLSPPYTETWTVPRDLQDTPVPDVPRSPRSEVATVAGPDAGVDMEPFARAVNDYVPRCAQDSWTDPDGYVADLGVDDPRLAVAPSGEVPHLTDEDIYRPEASDDYDDVTFSVGGSSPVSGSHPAGL